MALEQSSTIDQYLTSGSLTPSLSAKHLPPTLPVRGCCCRPRPAAGPFPRHLYCYALCASTADSMFRPSPLAVRGCCRRPAAGPLVPPPILLRTLCVGC